MFRYVKINNLIGLSKRWKWSYIYDVLAIPTAWFLSYWLRYNLEAAPKHVITTYSCKAFYCLFIIQLVCYALIGVQRGRWQYVSMNDLYRIIKSVALCSFISIPALYLVGLLGQVPRSILPLYFILLVGLLSLARFGYRAYKENFNILLQKTSQKKRVLIIGAGSAGESLARNLLRDNHNIPVGFVDDASLKVGSEIHGIRILGKLDNLKTIVRKFQVDLVFIAIPSASSSLMRRIVELCEKSTVPFRTLPSVSQLVNGNVALNDLRPVRIEDLLGREPVDLDWDKIVNEIENKVILITGAGGSIGSELCRQVAKLLPKKIILVEHSEYHLYLISEELKQEFPDLCLESYLLNITDKVGVNNCFQQTLPQIVFHAAAYKHVPMLENQIRMAVFNNVIGTQVVAETAVKHQVEKFVLISTDKAVNPANIMGMTKRVAEIYCQNLNEQSSTQFVTVRFGNVLGSTGSVIPLFTKQLAAGGPITVTHPDITRYFMTIPEACQLILQAMLNGLGGEIFVLDMGEPIKISYLAEQMIKLAGKVPDRDIKIMYTGLRPGEKLFEELFHESEALSTTSHDKLFKAKVRKLPWPEMINSLDLVRRACDNNDTEELSILIKSLVPENQHQDLIMTS